MTERIDAGRGLGQLVVTLLDIIRELLERQALRRMDAGTLSASEVERLGQSLIDLDRSLTEIREAIDDSTTTERRRTS